MKVLLVLAELRYLKSMMVLW